MPRNETVIGVFVASPSDVSEERKALESVVHELNKTWSKNLNLRLDLIKWETDIYPGFGEYSQDVINEQVNDEYDVFVAIFWGRSGTPTKRAESGTIEEFNRAYNKYKADADSVDIMVYFKDHPIPPSKMNYEQLKIIQDLKHELGEKGGLYWEFENTEDFESLLRSHLSKVAQKWSSKSNAIINSANLTGSTDLAVNNVVTLYEDEYEEYGLIDYLEIYEDRMFDMTAALASMSEATEKIGNQFTRRTDEINSLLEAGEHSDPKKARRVIKLSSDDMERYSEILELQITISSKSREEAFDALSKALSFYVDFKYEDNLSDLSDFEESLKQMIDAASGTLEGFAGYRETVSSLPRLTIQLNKAKRRVVNVLDSVLEEIKTTISSSNDVLAIIKELKN